MSDERNDRTFEERITGRTKDGRITDGSLPDGRPRAREVDTSNRAVKEKAAQPPSSDSAIGEAAGKAPPSPAVNREA